MFEIFKKFKKTNNKEGIIIAPIDGRLIELTEVKDEVFSKKLVGDGVAIETTGNYVKAPAEGELKMIFPTNHAFALLLDNGAELMVHIGLDTVELSGEGFTRLKEVGQRVKVGESIIKIDREYVESKGYSLVTPVLFTNMEEIEKIEGIKGQDVISGQDMVIQYKIK